MGDLHPPDLPENGGPPLPPPTEALISGSTSKRQRRPSVRLGEIGDQPAAASGAPQDPSFRRSKLSKTSTKPRATFTAAPRRVRTNWPLRLDNGFDSPAAAESKPSAGEDAMDDEYVEDSESLSGENVHRASARIRVSDGGDEPSEDGCRDWTGGIRSWLEGLGLRRYAPVFEIHEVDDEVLPLLTLEDLRDMGINAVGSRRKMYCAIQKLGKSKDSRGSFDF